MCAKANRAAGGDAEMHSEEWLCHASRRYEKRMRGGQPREPERLLRFLTQRLRGRRRCVAVCSVAAHKCIAA